MKAYKYNSWDDIIENKDLENLKVFPSGLIVGEKDDYVKNKADILKLKKNKRKIKDVFEAMLAFQIFDEDTLKSPEIRNRKFFINNISDKLLLDLWEILSIVQEVNYISYSACNFTEDRKIKYAEVYTFFLEYHKYIKKIKDLTNLYEERKIITNELIELKEPNKLINDNKLLLAKIISHYHNHNHDNDSIDIYDELEEYISKKTKDNIIFIDSDIKEKEKEIKKIDNKIVKINKELTGFNQDYPFRKTEENSNLISKVLSNLKASEYSDNLSRDVKNFIIEIIPETINRGLMKEASKCFSTPSILVDNDYLRMLDSLKNINGNNNIYIFEYLNESLSDYMHAITILWEAYGKSEKDFLVNNINETISNFLLFVENNKMLEGLNNIINTNVHMKMLNHFYAYGHKEILTPVAKIMLLREKFLNIDYDNNKNSRWDNLSTKDYLEIRELIENKIGKSFKVNNPDLYLPSTEVFTKEDVNIKFKNSIDVSISVKDLMGFQNKKFNLLLTKNNFNMIFNSYWKSLVSNSEGMHDFLSSDYLISKDGELSFTVKCIPNNIMNNEQLESWANILVKKLLMEHNLDSFNDVSKFEGDVEVLSQQEILKITGMRALSSKKVIKF